MRYQNTKNNFSVASYPANSGCGVLSIFRTKSGIISGKTS
jgi:hypothetical protein